MRRVIAAQIAGLIAFFIASFPPCASFAHIESQQLAGCSPEPESRFGISVAVDANTAVIGAYEADSNGPDSGAACVFSLSGSNWVQSQKLTASDGSPGDKFGRSVAIQGNTIVVGAYLENNNGSAYVFTRSGSVWSQQQKLVAPDAAANDKFGIAVSLDNNTLAVGAYGRQSNTGAVYVFTRTGPTWSFQQELTASDAANSDYFGISVAIEANTIIIGAHKKDYSDFPDAGAAYIFTRTGLIWSQQSVLYASDPANYDYFGFSVALDGNLAVIGAYECDIDGISDTGAAYVFAKTESGWVQQQKLFDSSAPGPGYDFGKSVAIEKDTIFAGCPRQVVDGNQTGAVFEFVRDGSTWLPHDMLTARQSKAEGNFGSSIAASADHLVIGAPFNDVNGSAYIFDDSEVVIADFDGDSDVDFYDFAVLAGSWLQNDPLRDIAPPFSGDGIVNIEDLALLCDNWLTGK